MMVGDLAESGLVGSTKGVGSKNQGTRGLLRSWTGALTERVSRWCHMVYERQHGVNVEYLIAAVRWVSEEK